MGLMMFSCSKPAIRDSSQPKFRSPEIAATGDPKKYEMADLKKRLWILPFEIMTNQSGGMERVPSAALFQNEIVKIILKDESPFIPPDEGYRDFQEIKVSSATDPTEVAQIAREAGAHGFLRGEFERLELVKRFAPEGVLESNIYEIIAKIKWDLYDANSARIVRSGIVDHTFQEVRSDILYFGEDPGTLPDLPVKVTELARIIAEKIYVNLVPFSEKIGWSGVVVRTEGNRAYINAGRRTGVQVGEVLKVMEAPKSIYDPGSGKEVGLAPGRMKGTVKVIQTFGVDGAIAILQSGGGVQTNDYVELY